MKVIKWLDKNFEEVILVFATIVMILLIFFQVVSRRFINSSLAWSEELSRIIFVWSVWLAVPYAVIKGRHIRLEILSDMVGNKMKFVLDMLFFVISAVFFAYIGYKSIEVVQGLEKMNQLTPALQFSKATCYLCLPIGGFLGAFRFIEYGWLRIRRFMADPTDRALVVVESK